MPLEPSEKLYAYGEGENEIEEKRGEGELSWMKKLHSNSK